MNRTETTRPGGSGRKEDPVIIYVDRMVLEL